MTNAQKGSWKNSLLSKRPGKKKGNLDCYITVRVLYLQQCVNVSFGPGMFGMFYWQWGLNILKIFIFLSIVKGMLFVLLILGPTSSFNKVFTNSMFIVISRQ